MRLELHPPELDLVDVVLFPISLQHLRLRGRDELGSRLGSRFQLGFDITDPLEQLQLFCLLPQQLFLQVFVTLALVLQLLLDQGDQPVFLFDFIVVNGANSLQLAPLLLESHLRPFVELLQPQILLTSPDYLCDLRCRYLIRFLGLREAVALLFVVGDAHHTVLDDDHFLVELLQQVCPCKHLRSVAIEPNLPQEGEVVLDLAPLGWVEVVRMHPPQLALLYLLLQQVALLEQQVDLPHELAGSIPSAFIARRQAGSEQLDTEVGVDGLQPLVALAVGSSLGLDARPELIDFPFGEVAGALGG